MNNITPPSLAISFSFRVAAYKGYGNDQEQAFLKTAKEFKRLITAIAIRTRPNDEEIRTYFFNDNTSCTFQDGFFTYKSKNYNHANK